jgi:hypothetical protein
LYDPWVLMQVPFGWQVKFPSEHSSMSEIAKIMVQYLLSLTSVSKIYWRIIYIQSELLFYCNRVYLYKHVPVHDIQLDIRIHTNLECLNKLHSNDICWSPHQNIHQYLNFCKILVLRNL